MLFNKINHKNKYNNDKKLLNLSWSLIAYSNIEVHITVVKKKENSKRLRRLKSHKYQTGTWYLRMESKLNKKKINTRLMQNDIST